MHAQKMKVDRLYKETQKSFLTITWPHSEHRKAKNYPQVGKH